MASRHSAPVGVTIGDFNGIGPEVALKAIGGRARPRGVRFALIGPADMWQAHCRRFGFPMPPLWRPGAPFPDAPAACWDIAGESGMKWTPGRVMPAASRVAVAALRAAVAAAMEGRLSAVVTAPICKEGLARAGLDAPGHTELLAEWTGARRFAMLLMGGPLRVALVTRHLPLRRVAEAVTRAAVREAIEISAEALPWLGCPRARIAVCGLNPHAGDGGALGDEEITALKPEIRAARRRGLAVEGPIPADVVFHRAVRGEFDLVVAMYHDQGLAPLKTIAFETGVNVTLGLPIVRVSPDHGTAFDIAGRGVADPRSFEAALRCAAALARRRNPWRKP